MCRDKAHVSGRREFIEVVMFPWPLIEGKIHDGSSYTGRIMTTQHGVSVLSDDASAWRVAFIMSSDSDFRLAMQKLVQR